MKRRSQILSPFCHSPARCIFSYLIINLALLVSTPLVAAADVKLAWDECRESQLAGYRVFSREDGGHYDYSNPAWEGSEPTCTIFNLVDGVKYFFVVRAFDIYGNESGDSNEVSLLQSDDADNDGMPDTWEQKYGLNPHLDDADQDLDRDGVSNRDEYLAGSDPTQISTHTTQFQPVSLLPLNGETDVGLTPRLEADIVSEVDSAVSPARAQWRITRAADDFCVFEVTSSSLLTTIDIPRLVLREDTTYFWQVRYFDHQDNVSVWSEPYFFTTAIRGEDVNADGIHDGQAVDDTIDVDGDGQSDLLQPNPLKCVNTEVGQGVIGVSVESAESACAIEWVQSFDTETIADSDNQPQSIPLGLIGFRLTVENPGDLVEVRVYFSEAMPLEAGWYKYDAVNGWQDYTAYAAFSADRKSVRLELVDGGFGDADGIQNGVIVDPSGPAIAHITTPDRIIGGSSGGSGGGCFIDTAAYGSTFSNGDIRPHLLMIVLIIIGLAIFRKKGSSCKH